MNVTVIGRTEVAADLPFSAQNQMGNLWPPGKGAPLLENVLARFPYEVVGEYPAGDHLLTLGGA